MNKEEIYNEIVKWENRHGENFLDNFNSDIHPLTFMSWCLGRNYLTPIKFNKWAEAYKAKELSANDPNYYVYDSDNGDVEFAVIISADWNDADQEKAHKVIAEFISEMDTYVSRFKEFINQN